MRFINGDSNNNADTDGANQDANNSSNSKGRDHGGQALIRGRLIERRTLLKETGSLVDIKSKL